MSKERRAERRREQEAESWRREEERLTREADFRRRFGSLEAKLEALGIDPYLLLDYLAETLKERL